MVFMGIISDVKCSRCDRRYSGLRSRCPYCGALRAKRGKRASDNDNALWKLIIGVLLLVVLIAAVIILLVTSLGGGKDETDGNTPGQNVTDNTGTGDEADQSKDDGQTDGTDGNSGVNSGDGNTTGNDNTPGSDDTSGSNDTPDSTTPGNTNDPDTTPNDTPATPQSSVESVKITYLGSATEDITLSTGTTLTLGCATTPSEVEATPVWKSSDESVLTVQQNGELHAVAKGTVDLTVTVDGVTATCIVRVK